MSKPTIFISHTADEKRVALALQENIKADFLDLFELFVSSDLASIHAGAVWLESVSDAIEKSTLVLILFSWTSLRKPWINFEGGAAWALKKTILPICYGGLQPADVPTPFNIFHAVDISTAEGVQRLYARLGALVNAGVPRRNFSELSSEINRLATPAESWDEGTVRASPQELNRIVGTWKGEARDVDLPGLLHYANRLTYDVTLTLSRADRIVGGKLSVYCREKSMLSDCDVRVIAFIGEFFSYAYRLSSADAHHFGVSIVNVLGVGTQMRGFYLSKKIFENTVGFGTIEFDKVTTAP